MREVCINSEGQCENRFCFSSFCWDCLFGHCVYIRVHLIYYFPYSIQIVLTIIATSQQHFFIVCSSLHFDCIERKKKNTRRKQPGFYTCPHRFEICSPTTALLCWQSLILCILGHFFPIGTKMMTNAMHIAQEIAFVPIVIMQVANS